MTPTPDNTRGRMCWWYDDHGNVVQLSVDAWDASHELTTMRVRPIGPFDDVTEIITELADLLTAQGVLF